ncbi:MAG: hypothetical protein LBM96_07525 [Methanobrevibacter sp.]|jgi:hypothetical protein|nr:hypothetical protein [Candidatus Methanoflexus mossambicus]
MNLNKKTLSLIFVFAIIIIVLIAIASYMSGNQLFGIMNKSGSKFFATLIS